jgi:hypothetical protein
METIKANKGSVPKIKAVEITTSNNMAIDLIAASYYPKSEYPERTTDHG